MLCTLQAFITQRQLRRDTLTERVPHRFHQSEPVLWTCWRGPDRVFMGLRTPGTRADGGFAAPRLRGNIPRLILIERRQVEQPVARTDSRSDRSIDQRRLDTPRTEPAIVGIDAPFERGVVPTSSLMSKGVRANF